MNSVPMHQFIEQELQASGLDVNEIAHAVMVDSEVQKQRDGKNYRLYTAPGIRGRVAQLCGKSITTPHFNVAFDKAVKAIHRGNVKKAKGSFLLSYDEGTDTYTLLKWYNSEKGANAARSSYSKTYGKENLFVI